MTTCRRPGCGKEIPASRRAHHGQPPRYCSNECFEKSRNKRREEYRQCALPGCEELTQTTYCSHAHKCRHYRQMKAKAPKQYELEPKKTKAKERPWPERRAAIVAKYGQHYENRHAPQGDVIRCWRAEKVA